MVALLDTYGLLVIILFGWVICARLVVLGLSVLVVGACRLAVRWDAGVECLCCGVV